MNIPSKLFGLDSKNKLFEFRCSGCGEIHRGSPSFSYDSPVVYRTIPEAERENRSRISDDLCEIDDEFYFIKATLDIPILGVAEPLNWGLWISQSKNSFDRYVESFEGDQSEFG